MLWGVFSALYGPQYPIRLLRVSHYVMKSLFFNMVQPIELICCKMIEIIEQNFFIRADFIIRSWFSFSGQINVSADDVTHIK